MMTQVRIREMPQAGNEICIMTMNLKLSPRIHMEDLRE